MKYVRIKPGGSLQGELEFPGDKSITHRAIIIGSLARDGCEVTLNNWLMSLDCLATKQALQHMGVEFKLADTHKLIIKSVGLHGLQKPVHILDAGNSGTTMRLLTGVLAAQKFSSAITGDASLCKRPMHRVIAPLTMMGAKIQAVNEEYPPLIIQGGQSLRGIVYNMPVASAQVKSAILLASLYAEGKTHITSPSICRDHTEVMLEFFAHKKSHRQINLNIPGDISSATFFIVGACVTPGSDLLLRNIGINPTRNGVISILQQMGAAITVLNQQQSNGEWHADLRVKYNGRLQAIKVAPQIIANAIDDLPALCLAAACASGTTEIRGALELRYKESDRIAMLAKGFSNLGINVSEYADGLAITGGIISGGEIATAGDHRIAMTFAMAGLVAEREIIVQDTANIATSFPNFLQLAIKAGINITEESVCPI